MQPGEPWVKAGASLREAAKEVAASGSDLLVMDGSETVGVIGSIDILRAIAKGGRLGSRVAEAMIKQVPIVRRGASMPELLSAAMSGARSLLVVESGKLVGRMEIGEVLELLAESWDDVEVHRALSTLVRHRMAELLSVRPMSVDQIAKAVGVKPITARHHLEVMKRSGIVGTEEVRGRVGRPLTLFRLIGLHQRGSRLAKGEVGAVGRLR